MNKLLVNREIVKCISLCGAGLPIQKVRLSWKASSTFVGSRIRIFSLLHRCQGDALESDCDNVQRIVNLIEVHNLVQSFPMTFHSY